MSYADSAVLCIRSSDSPQIHALRPPLDAREPRNCRSSAAHPLNRLSQPPRTNTGILCVTRTAHRTLRSPTPSQLPFVGGHCARRTRPRRWVGRRGGPIRDILGHASMNCESRLVTNDITKAIGLRAHSIFDASLHSIISSTRLIRQSEAVPIKARPDPGS